MLRLDIEEMDSKMLTVALGVASVAASPVVSPPAPAEEVPSAVVSEPEPELVWGLSLI